MPGFGDVEIPEELFQDILSYNLKECLPVLSLVSRDWHASVTPILYRDINLVWRRTRYLCHRNYRRSYRTSHPSPCACESTGLCEQSNHPEDLYKGRAFRPCLKEVSSSPFNTYPSLYLLVRTLLHLPIRANFVRSLSLIGAVPLSVWTDAEQTGLSNYDRDRVQHVLRQRLPTVCSRKQWLDDLDQGCPSAFAAFLLVYLNRLEKIEIGAEFSRLFSFVGPSTIRQLTRLTTASIGTFRDEVYIAPGRVPLDRSASLHHPLLFFNLPNVRHLSLNVPKPLENLCFRWPIGGLIPLTTNLESLELTFTFLNERKLAYILRACPRLRTLRYDLWTTSEDIASREEGRVDLPALQQALLPVKSTLETLHLHIGKYHWASGSWNDDWDNVLGQLTFHDYPRLRMLHVPIRVLIDTRTWEMDESWEMRLSSIAKVDLGAVLPKTLMCLWINLDGFEFPAEDCPGTPPLLGDEGLVQVLSAFLHDRLAYTPLLRTLKLLVSQIPSLVHDQWNPYVLSNALVTQGDETGVGVSVDTVLYRCASTIPSHLSRQLPPYFDQDTIDNNRMLLRGANRFDEGLYGRHDPDIISILY